MRVALTGATGFVGSHTVRPLIEAGHRVRALVRPGRNAGWLEDLGIELDFPEVLNRLSDGV